MTTATIEILKDNKAILEVNYPNGKFSIHLIKGHNHYERGYDLACFYASQHGYRLEMFKNKN